MGDHVPHAGDVSPGDTPMVVSELGRQVFHRFDDGLEGVEHDETVPDPLFR